MTVFLAILMWLGLVAMILGATYMDKRADRKRAERAKRRAESAKIPS